MLSVLLTAMLIQSSKGAFFSDKILSKEDLDVTQEGNKYSVNISVVNLDFMGIPELEYFQG